MLSGGLTRQGFRRDLDPRWFDLTLSGGLSPIIMLCMVTRFSLQELSGVEDAQADARRDGRTRPFRETTLFSGANGDREI